MKTLFALLGLCSLTLIFSCSENDKRKSSKNDTKLEEEASAPIEENLERVYYPIPSPEQMFGFINDNGVSYSKSLTNSTEKADSYITPTSKSLNFGVYTADLAYAAAYQDMESTIGLYKTVKRLGADLNIEEMMSEEMMEKMQSNMENPDSLAIIAGNSYYQAVEYLEKNGQEGKLALMSLGGWVESLYITLNSIKKFNPDSPTANRIASQKITFGNLYTYLKKNEEKMGVSGEISKIQEIRGVFASLLEERSGKTVNNSNGKLVIGRGKKITMTEGQFKELKKAINNYRNNIVGQAS